LKTNPGYAANASRLTNNPAAREIFWTRLATLDEDPARPSRQAFPAHRRAYDAGSSCPPEEHTHCGQSHLLVTTPLRFRRRLRSKPVAGPVPGKTTLRVEPRDRPVSWYRRCRLALAIRRRSNRVFCRWHRTQSAAQLSGELEPESPSGMMWSYSTSSSTRSHAKQRLSCSSSIQAFNHRDGFCRQTRPGGGRTGAFKTRVLCENIDRRRRDPPYRVCLAPSAFSFAPRLCA
jgi:hypothetical protein